MRLRRSDVNSLGAHDRRGATVDTEQSAGRTAVETDVGDAQWVVCEGSSQKCIIVLGELLCGFGRVRGDEVVILVVWERGGLVGR